MRGDRPYGKSRPLPQAERQRERDRRYRDRDVVTVRDDGVVRGPALPDDHGFDDRTVAYSETWSSSPQAQLFEATDWLALQLLPPLYDSNLCRPSAAAVSEIRLTTAALGGTYADRLRVAKIHVARDGDDSPVAAVTPIRFARTDRRVRPRRDPEPTDGVDEEQEPGF